MLDRIKHGEGGGGGGGGVRGGGTHKVYGKNNFADIAATDFIFASIYS